MCESVVAATAAIDAVAEHVMNTLFLFVYRIYLYTSSGTCFRRSIKSIHLLLSVGTKRLSSIYDVCNAGLTFIFEL